MRTLSITAGFLDTNGRWTVAVGDGELCAQGHGTTFGEGLKKAITTYRRAPFRYGEPEPVPPRAPWAYVDVSSAEGPDDEQWVEIFVWAQGDVEPTTTELESLDGRMAIVVPTMGARCIKWRGRYWLHLPDEGDEFLRDVDDHDLGGSEDAVDN